MLEATSDGLRQQSVARRAVIKVSCLPKILPSVMFCTTLKPNEQFSGNSVWVQQRQRRNPYSGSDISDRQSSLQTSQKDKNDRIPFTLTFHPHNHAVKSIILSNFKLLQNDPETGRIFSQPPLISFKRDKNVGNFLVRSALKTNEQPGTFKCARSRCKTCLFIVNTSKISGPKRSVKITDRFTCTSANVIYCITCTLCNKLYIGETGRRLGDRFREHLRDVEKNDKDASKPVARHFNLPNLSKKHMAICGLSLHLGTTESRKNLEQKFIFQIGTLNPHGINERFSFN